MLGGSFSLGLAKSSDSIRESRLGGLHSARQARTVGEFPEAVAQFYLYEKWRRFMLPWGKGWGIGVRGKGYLMPSDEVRFCSEEQGLSPCRKVPHLSVS